MLTSGTASGERSPPQQPNPLASALENKLRAEFAAQLGAEVSICVERVADIPRTASGKFMVTVSEVALQQSSSNSGGGQLFGRHAIMTKNNRKRPNGFSSFFMGLHIFSTKRSNSMAEHKGAEHHKKAAEHHEHAATHHKEAAKHHEAGNHEKAGHHAHTAHGHQIQAEHHGREAAKHHSDEHGGNQK
jgi:hypothetical protein